MLPLYNLIDNDYGKYVIYGYFKGSHLRNIFLKWVNSAYLFPINDFADFYFFIVNLDVSLNSKQIQNVISSL